MAAIEREATPIWSSPPAPPADTGILDVDFRCNFYKLGNFDLRALTCYTEIHFAFYWTDERLVGWTGPLPGQLWGPSLDFVNRIETVEVPGNEFELLSSSEGRLKRVLRYAGTISNPARYNEFPFDFDDVQLRFNTHGTWSSLDKSCGGALATGESYRLRSIRAADGTLRREDQGRDFIGLLLPTDLGEYALIGVSYQLTRTANIALSGNPAAATQFTVSAYICRRPGFYVFKVLLPLWLTVAVNFMVFFFEEDDIADRISLIMTTLLASFALQYIAGDILPKLDYLTVVDRVTLVSHLAVFMCAVCSCVCKVLASRDGDKARAEAVNFIGGWAIIGSWAAGTVAVGIPSIVKQRQRMSSIRNCKQSDMHALFSQSMEGQSRVANADISARDSGFFLCS